MNKAHTCIRCRFYDETDDTCHRYAPRTPTYEFVGGVKAPTMIVTWPVVAEEDWCGEFETDRKCVDKRQIPQPPSGVIQRC